MTRLRAVAVTVLSAAGIAGAEAKECRPPEAPPGVRVQAAPGCRPPVAAAPAKGTDAMQRAGTTPGFIDLGNGSEVRIGGRVRVDTTYSR